jgi:hypothetical protein
MKQKIGVGEDGFGNCVVGDGTPDSVAVVVAAGWMKGRVDVWMCGRRRFGVFPCGGGGA